MTWDLSVLTSELLVTCKTNDLVPALPNINYCKKHQSKNVNFRLLRVNNSLISSEQKTNHGKLLFTILWFSYHLWSKYKITEKSLQSFMIFDTTAKRQHICNNVNICAASGWKFYLFFWLFVYSFGTFNLHTLYFFKHIVLKKHQSVQPYFEYKSR